MHEVFDGHAIAATRALSSIYNTGTHCAATAGGKDYGVATGANIYAMKVLSNSGGGSESRIIAAMDAVADVVKRKKVKGPTVVSMSLGGPCADKDCSFGNDYSKAVSDLRDLGVLTVRRGV